MLPGSAHIKTEREETTCKGLYRSRVSYRFQDLTVFESSCFTSLGEAVWLPRLRSELFTTLFGLPGRVVALKHRLFSTLSQCHIFIKCLFRLILILIYSLFRNP